MPLTAKQQTAIAKAPAKQKQQLRNLYHRQQLNKNSNNNQPQRMIRRPPGLARQNTTPKPGPKPAPKRTMPIKIPNYLDPLCTLPVPTALSDGKALPHTGIVRSNFTTATNQVTLLVVQNTGVAGTVAYRIRLNVDGSHHSEALLTIPTMANGPVNGGPTACRAMKCSASLVNNSNVMHRGGRVMYLNSSQRLPSRAGPGTGEFNDILAGIRSSPYSRTISGDSLKTPFQLISFPIDPVAYNQFMPFEGTLVADEFRDYVFSPPWDQGTSFHVRAMSTIVYLVEPTDEPQDYTLTVRASFYTRWPLSSLPGQSMQHMPTAPANVINKVRDHAEANAQELVKTNDDAVQKLSRAFDPWNGSE